MHEGRRRTFRLQGEPEKGQCIYYSVIWAISYTKMSMCMCVCVCECVYACIHVLALEHDEIGW